MTTEEQKRERALLRSYLSRYRKAKNRVQKLRTRRQEFIEDMKYPLGAQSYSGLPRSSTPNDGAATYVFRLCEIEEKIIEQEKNANNIMLQIMDIMDFLPEDSESRCLLEMKYIDGLSEKQIMAAQFYSSRSSVAKYINNGLNELLTFKKIQNIITRYEKGMEEIRNERSWQ